jgi:filamentous hemagglutinin family protein
MATTQRKTTVNPAARPRAVALAVATAFLPWYLPQTTYAQAPDPNTLPTGGQITNGTGQIHAPQGTHLQIDQYTQKMIAQFGSFSIGANASVNLSQPGASSIALFRDVGGDPSRIFGNLTANGQLFISNQNGVLFGASARVDVGALFATSLSITDHDFMAGRYQWHNEGNAGSVVNQGQIVTANGYTALVGPQVRNDGIIVARAGSVALAAGDRVSLDMIGDGLISLSVDQSAYHASVVNTGSITADGGTVLLTARSANALLDTVINNSGTIRANSLVERNGQIVLDGGNAGVVSVTGTLEAKGIEAGTQGGTIHALGANVGIFGNAVLDASGYAGGGEIRIGGGWQGGEGLSEAQNTFLGRDATLRADALRNGDGGSIVMWAQGSTRAHGMISVQGGAEGGDGGRVETSGLNGLEVTRAPNLSAPKGKGGLWLLDPHNLTVVDTAVNSNYDEDPAGTFTSNADGADIADDVIETALNNGGAGGATVVLATGSGGAEAGTIDVQASIDFNGASASTLVMRAHDDIIFTAGVTAAGSGLNLQLFANDNTDVGGALAGSTRSADLVSGNGDVLVSALLSLNGGSFQSSGRNFNNTAGITTGGGNVTINHLGDVSIGAAVNAGGGTVDINFGQANGGSTFTLTAALTGGTKTVTGGTGSDVLDLDGAPTTTATLDGGAGSDRIELTGDTDFTLSNASLTTISGHNLTLASMEVATLTGGAADNSFTVSGWSGTGTLDGAGGTGDSIVAVNDVAAIDLTNTSLARATLGTLTLANIEVADLTGGAGVNAFTVSNWTGSATLRGDANNDSYTVSLTGAGSGSVTVVDSAGTDTVTVEGTAGGDAFTLTDSAVTLGTETVSYTSADVETLAVNGLASNDTFTVSNLTRSATLDGGTGAGDAIVATNDVDFTLTNTSLARSGGQAALTLANMESATLTGGAADNSFTVSGWSGTGTLDGAGGTNDSIAATNDVDFTLTNASLGRTALGTLTLANIELATLTGGGSANTFTVSGWSGTGTLDGLLGSDTVVAVNDVADFALTNTTLDRTGTAQLTLSGIEVANLTGGGSANTFTVSGWTGAGTLDGLLGSDTVVAINDVADFTLANASLARTALGTLTLSGIEVANLTGGGSANTFTVSGWSGTGTLDGLLGSDTVVAVNNVADFALTNATLDRTGTGQLTLSGIEVANLTGGGSANTFTVSGWTGTGTLDGLLGSDTVVAVNDLADFPLTNASLARTGLGTLTLSGIEVANLTGGGSANTFTVSGWTGTGALDGDGATDMVVASQDAATFTLADTTLDRAGTGQLTLSGIEVANLTGGGSANTFTLSGWTGSASITGGGGTDTLVGPNATNIWTVDGAGDGNINGTVAFIDISHLTGGTTTDTFTFTTGTLAGNIDGGTGTNSIDIAAVAGANTINLQAGTVSTVLGGTFTNVTSFTGDNIADTLVGTNANTAWTISGANDGSLSTGQTFTGIASLTGGTLDDSFTLASGTLSGSINGAGGNDTLSGSTTYVVTGGNSGTATGITGGFSSIENLVGTAGADTFTLSGGTLAGTVDGLAGTDTLIGDNVANTWTITGPNSGTLTGTGGWLNIENLVGGTSTDSFSGILAGSVGGTVSDGGGGATALSGTINSGGSQTYSAAVSSAGVTLNAGTAAVSATNAGNNFTGPLSVTGSSASITDMNALTIAATSVGSLNVTASGAVDQTGAITVTGATNINAGGNAITLTSANDFQGTVSLTGGTTQITDTNSLTLGTVNTGALTTVNTGALNLGTGTVNGALSSTTNGGNITQTGALGVTGTTNLQAGAGSIVLAMANDFAGAVAASGIGIILNDVNTLAPGTINAGSGSVSLSANSLGAGGTVSAGAASSLSSNTNVNGLDINMPNVPLALSGAATQWNFTSTPTSIPQPNPVTVPGGNVGVTYNLASIIASIAQQQAASASSSVSATVSAVIVDEANKTFGTDSVAEDVEYGFAGEVGTTPPMDHRIDESGISLPRCVQESREGLPCK